MKRNTMIVGILLVLVVLVTGIAAATSEWVEGTAWQNGIPQGLLEAEQANGIGYPLVNQPGGSPAWSLATQIYTDGTKVGIGTTSPGQKLDIESGNLEVDAGYGMRSETGASIKTGANGGTMRIAPGTNMADIVAFDDYQGSTKVKISASGDIVVNGICFEPRVLIRCNIESNTDHFTWVDTQNECTNAGGLIEDTLYILAECSAP